MASKTLEAVLNVGEKVHPLMGPIFTGRPNSKALGEQCSMCVTPNPSDTAIIDRDGLARYICITHELMLTRAFAADKTGRTAIDHYQGEVFANIMQDADQPRWMPAFLYRRLVARADAKARMLALITVLGMGAPLTYAEPAQ